MNDIADDRVEDARLILGMFEFDQERTNERSARVLLALLHLKPADPWSGADSPMLGTRAIMDWIRDYYGINYAANTRETVRKSTLHQFIDAMLVEQNPDKLDRAVNSPKSCYRLNPRALEGLWAYGTEPFHPLLTRYLADVPGLKVQYDAARKMERIPVMLPGGGSLDLSPGGQNTLIKQIVEDFCAYFTPGGQVLYVGDADAKWAIFEPEILGDLGVVVDQHGKMPDLVIYMRDRNWLVLMEAVDSHGPVDAKRHGELATLFSGATAGLAYVSCFPSRAVMRKYLTQIAWETEAWCADSPTHLIHFNGKRLVGPHGEG